MTTQIKEIIQLDSHYVMIIYTNKKLCIFDTKNNVTTCCVDLSENDILTVDHKIKYFNGTICVVSPNGTEFYSTEKGNLDFIGMVPQKVPHENEELIFTDCAMDENRIMFSTQSGHIMFVEYPSLEQQAVFKYSDDPIVALEYSPVSKTLFLVKERGHLLSHELETMLNPYLNCVGEEDLFKYFPETSIDNLKLITTDNGVLVLTNGRVLEFVKRTLTMNLYPVENVQDVIVLGDKLFFCTFERLIVLNRNDTEDKQSFGFALPSKPIHILLQYPDIVVFMSDAVHRIPIPIVRSRKSIVEKQTLPFKYKSYKISQNTPLLNLIVDANNILYAMDNYGTIFYSSTEKCVSNQIFGKVIPYQQILYPISYITPNNMYGVFGCGNTVEVAYVDTKQYVLTLYTPKSENMPGECMTCIDGNKENQSLFIAGLHNGMVIQIDTYVGEIKILHKHDFKVIGIQYYEDGIASLDKEGYLYFGQKKIRPSQYPISFDIYQNHCIIVEKHSVQLLSLKDVQVLALWEIDSDIINAIYSQDGKLIIVVTKSMVVMLKNDDLSIVSKFPLESLMNQVKENGDVVSMNVSHSTPPKLVIGLSSGYVIIVEPTEYEKWIM